MTTTRTDFTDDPAEGRALHRSSAGASSFARWMVGIGLIVTASACSSSLDFSIGGQSVEDAAVELIEGDLADLIGLGELEATCPEVADPEVGATFECTATTTIGETVKLAGVVDAEDHIDVQTTNVIVADSVAEVEAAGVQLINDTEGVTLDVSAMDCGDTSIVLPEDNVLRCTLTDPETGDVLDATYTITDIETGEFELEWAPRG